MARIDEILALTDDTAFAIALSDLVYGIPGGEGIEGLSEAEATVFAISNLEREVNNGGFSQFFFNSAGDDAHETLAALRRIGATRMADLLERAMTPFGPAGPSRDPEERWKQLDALADSADDLWSELSGRFQDYPENLSALMRAYVAANRERFRE